MSVPASEASSLEAALVALIEENLPGVEQIGISNLRQAPAGSSTENWFFDAAWMHHGERRNFPLILRLAPRSEVVFVERCDEFHLLAALERSSVPAPRAFWLDAAGRHFGRPGMVLQRCQGVARRDLLTDCRLTLEARSRIGVCFAATLAALHSTPASLLPLPASLSQPRGARALLERYDTEVTRDAPTSIEMKIGAWWLREHLPNPPKQPVVVHGDFRPANVLVDGETVTAVLDWEFAHVGDPAEDIGWFLAPIYRNEHFPAGLWSPRDFLSRYEQLTGTEVSMEAVRWWMVFALYKLATIALATAKAFKAGDARRLIRSTDYHFGPLLEAIAHPDEVLAI